MTFEEYLTDYIKKLKEDGRIIIESSHDHVIYENRIEVWEILHEERLTKKMKERFPGTHFVVRNKWFKKKEPHDISTVYELRKADHKSDFRIGIVVFEKDNKLFIESGTTKYKELTDALIEEIKNLPAYRLKAITQ